MFRLKIGAALALALFGGWLNSAVAGKPPELYSPIPIDYKVATGHQVEFQIHYKDEEGDPPLELGVILTSPTGNQVTVTANSSVLANVKNDSLVPIFYVPTETGTYHYYFYARDADGRSIYPEQAKLDFTVQPNWLPYAEIGVGFLVSFLIITTLIYQVMHRGLAMSQHNSARVAIMVGIVCWIVCILYAMNWLTNVFAWIAAAIVMLLLIVWAATAR